MSPAFPSRPDSLRRHPDGCSIRPRIGTPRTPSCRSVTFPPRSAAGAAFPGEPEILIRTDQAARSACSAWRGRSCTPGRALASSGRRSGTDRWISSVAGPRPSSLLVGGASVSTSEQLHEPKLVAGPLVVVEPSIGLANLVHQRYLRAESLPGQLTVVCRGAQTAGPVRARLPFGMREPVSKAALQSDGAAPRCGRQ